MKNKKDYWISSVPNILCSLPHFPTFKSERHAGYFTHLLDRKFLVVTDDKPLKTEIIYFIELSKEFSVYNEK